MGRQERRRERTWYHVIGRIVCGHMSWTKDIRKAMEELCLVLVPWLRWSVKECKCFTKPCTRKCKDDNNNTPIYSSHQPNLPHLHASTMPIPRSSIYQAALLVGASLFIQVWLNERALHNQKLRHERSMKEIDEIFRASQEQIESRWEEILRTIDEGNRRTIVSVANEKRRWFWQK